MDKPALKALLILASLAYGFASHGQDALAAPATPPAPVAVPAPAPNPCHTGNPARIDNGVSAWLPSGQVLASQEKMRAEELATYVSGVAASWKTLDASVKDVCAIELNLALDKLQVSQTFKAAPVQLLAAARTLKDALDKDTTWVETDKSKTGLKGKVLVALDSVTEADAESDGTTDALHVVKAECRTDFQLPRTFSTPEAARASLTKLATTLATTATAPAATTDTANQPESSQQSEAASSAKASQEPVMEKATPSDPVPWWGQVASLLSRDPTVMDELDSLTRDKIVACAKVAFEVANRSAVKEAADNPGSDKAIAAAAVAEPARKAYLKVAQVATFYEPQASLFVGPNFSLDSEGGWKGGGGEALLRFDAGPKSFLGGRSFTEISYQKIEAIDKEATDQQKSDALKNPFASKQGFFRINSGVTFRDSGRHGLLVSAGLSSIDTDPDSDAESFARVEPRLSVGMNSRTFFTEGTYSQYFIGYAYDQFWEYDEVIGMTTDTPPKPIAERRKEFDRAIVDATLYLPQISTGQVKAAVRLFVDTPLSGHGPSDIRASVLLYLDFNDFLKHINPLLGK